MHGDILKFYRHTQIPLTDYIFYYGHGRDGFKQVGSAADLYDRRWSGRSCAELSTPRWTR